MGVVIPVMARPRPAAHPPGAAVPWGVPRSAARALLARARRPSWPRLGEAATLLAHPHPAVRTAGVHVLGALAPAGPTHAQACVDVLCAVLRVPPSRAAVRAPSGAGTPDDRTSAGAPAGPDAAGEAQVRAAVLALLQDRMRPGGPHDWTSCRPDLSGAHLHDVDFTGCRFGRGARFDDAVLSGASCFDGARFGAAADFARCRFDGAARFADARFDADARFSGARFTAGADFSRADFTAGAWFSTCRFDARAWFADARFRRRAWFVQAELPSGADVVGARFEQDAWFTGAHLAGRTDLARAHVAGRVWTEGAVLDLEGTPPPPPPAPHLVRVDGHDHGARGTG